MFKIESILNTIICGNALTVLKQIPDNTISMCCTSPPYYNCRDYQTAEWIGGDENCKHQNGRKERAGLTSKQSTNNGSFGDEAFKEFCKMCGAVRKDEQIGLEESPDCGKAGLFKLKNNLTQVQKDALAQWFWGEVSHDVHSNDNDDTK